MREILMEAESVYTPEFARRVMPQKEPMLFVDHVISVDEGELLSGTVSFTPGKRPCEGLLPDGSLAAPAVLESMAQSYALLRAAFNVIRGISDGPVAPGVFVSARSFELLWNGNFPAGEEIIVSCRKISEVSGFSRFDAEALLRGEPAARGRLGVRSGI